MWPATHVTLPSQARLPCCSREKLTLGWDIPLSPNSILVLKFCFSLSRKWQRPSSSPYYLSITVLAQDKVNISIKKRCRQKQAFSVCWSAKLNMLLYKGINYIRRLSFWMRKFTPLLFTVCTWYIFSFTAATENSLQASVCTERPSMTIPRAEAQSQRWIWQQGARHLSDPPPLTPNSAFPASYCRNGQPNHQGMMHSHLCMQVDAHKSIRFYLLVKALKIMYEVHHFCFAQLRGELGLLVVWEQNQMAAMLVKSTCAGRDQFGLIYKLNKHQKYWRHCTHQCTLSAHAFVAQ